MKRILLAFLWLACALPSLATTWSVNASQSAATIQGVISGASAGDTVSFAAGTYSITAGLTLKCGVTYTGPVATPATAILNATFTRESASIFNLYPGAGYAVPCTQPTTIEYFNFENDGGVYVQTSFSNLTITHNQFTNLPCCNNQAHDTGIFFDGGEASNNSTQILSNATITWNTFGDANSCESPSTGSMENTGDDVAGYCGGMATFSTVNGMTIEYNKTVHIGEGMSFGCPAFPGITYPCEPLTTGPQSVAGVTTTNVTAMYNDFAGVHRIAWEEQPQTTSGIVFQYNSYHDPYVPFFGTFDLSFACCENGATAPYLVVNNNVLVENTPNSACPSYTGYGIEAHGNHASFSYNMVQGLNGAALSKFASPPCSSGPDSVPAIVYGFTANASYNYNYICGPYFNGQYIEPEDSGYSPPASITGNNEASSCATTTSVAPAISPAGGSHTSPLTVTLSDPGYTSGAVAQGNTSIWYTTDGSTPVPGQGTAQLYTGPITVTLPATVKSVGMWGTGANPLSYPSGYGFVPSAVVSATYTAGGGVTLSSVSIAGTGGANALTVGGTLQMIATCHYSNGSTTGCNTPDSYGNSVTAWGSSSANVTINSSGLATGAGIGTANITATVTGGLISPVYGLTVSSSGLTLGSVTLGTAGSVTSITAGTTNQLIATCHYSDGSTTSCGSGMDAHGNIVGSWASSAPASATVSSSGLVTGVGAGSTNLSASVTPAPTQIGTNVFDTPGTTAATYENLIYGVTGTAAAGYTPVNCNIILPNVPAAGAHWDCILSLAPTPTTQASSALCSNRYTTTGQEAANAAISISMSSCPKLPADTAYWLASTTDGTGTPPQGFTSCGGSCTGGVPMYGSGTYPYYWTGGITFGTYTSLPTTLNLGGSVQVSQYLTLTTVPVTSPNLSLTITAPPPTLSSAYLTASSSSIVVGSTLQMAAKCVYTNPSTTTDCTVADIYGNAVSQWSSSDTTKATIGAVGTSNAGLVTAVAPGSPSITAVINGGLTSSAFPLTVTAPSVTLTAVSLATTNGVTGIFVGQTNALIATCLYSDGSHTSCNTTDSHGNVARNYSSSSTAHATVNATSGVVTGVTAGTTNLTAQAGSATSANLPLTVLAMPTGVYTITITGPVSFSGSVSF